MESKFISIENPIDVNLAYQHIALNVPRFCEVWCHWLLARQINFGVAVNKLSDLAGRSALRNGRLFDVELVTQNNRQPRLWKVGLEDDVVVSEGARLRTRGARLKLKTQRGIASKLKRYLFSESGSRLHRVFGYVSGRLRHRLLCTRAFNPHTDTEWALVPGINFWQTDDGSFVCLDHGAIYEDFLTTDASRYPSQVGIDLYTSSNAAYLFRWMAERDSSIVWSDALFSAKRYFTDFFKFPRQRLEFDHREFDYTALRLAFDQTVAAPFAGWTAYDPVNVFGLRWDNLAQAPEERSVIRLALSRWMVSHHQTDDGLIRDNHLGRAVHAGDLTYHQYCLAGLALGNAVLDDPKVDHVIQRGLQFSISMQLPNGEVSFYGRGANNIYHLAAFIAALAVAAVRYKWDVSVSLALAMQRLHSALHPSPEGSIAPPLPTALNDAPIEQMVGWHGSCAQYGAQSAFLLARATPFLRQAAELGGAVYPVPSTPLTRRPVHACIRSGVGDAQVVLAVTAGSECMRWNNGQHVSGYAGLTALVIGSCNRLLTNERVMQDDGQSLLLSDITDQAEHDHGELCTSANGLALSLQGKLGKRSVHYGVADGSWSVSLYKQAGETSYSLPLQGTPELKKSGDRSFALIFPDGVSVDATADLPIEIQSVPVIRSCHGTGVLFRISTAAEALKLSFVVTIPANAE